MPTRAAPAAALLGKVAIANAKLAYQRYQELFSGPRWQRPGRPGAQTQRLLWASTGTKNPHYRDVLYVEELIGPDTVNTDPAGDARRVPRSRASAREPDRRPRRRARHHAARSPRSASRSKKVTDTLLADGVAALRRARSRKLLERSSAQSSGAGAGADPSPSTSALPDAARAPP